MSDLGSLLDLHAATVETYTGAGPRGATYAAPVTVRGFLDDGASLQLGGGAAETVAVTRFYTDLSNKAALVVGSRVTCNGRSAHVTTVRLRDGGSLLAGLSHVEVELA